MLQLPVSSELHNTEEKSVRYLSPSFAAHEGNWRVCHDFISFAKMAAGSAWQNASIRGTGAFSGGQRLPAADGHESCGASDQEDRRCHLGEFWDSVGSDLLRASQVPAALVMQAIVL